MADIAAVYDETRGRISELVLSLSPDVLNRPVPATPGWTIKDVVAHLSGDVTCALKGDFPREFFAAFGDPAAVVTLNDWTARMVEERRAKFLAELLDEWEQGAGPLLAMLRGDAPLSDGLPPFADRVLVTDVGVHQQDIHGALGLVRDRDSAPVRIGLSGYVATVTWRLGGLAPLRFQTEDKAYTAGEGEPGASVTASRFELFRAMSGRRSPDQIRAYEWDGDPEPYLPMFYPYGPRESALLEG